MIGFSSFECVSEEKSLVVTTEVVKGNMATVTFILDDAKKAKAQPTTSATLFFRVFLIILITFSRE